MVLRLCLCRLSTEQKTHFVAYEPRHTIWCRHLLLQVFYTKHSLKVAVQVLQWFYEGEGFSEICAAVLQVKMDLSHLTQYLPKPSKTPNKELQEFTLYSVVFHGQHVIVE